VFYLKKGLDTKQRVAVLIKHVYKATPAFSWNIPIFGGFFNPPTCSIQGDGVLENLREGGITAREKNIVHRFSTFHALQARKANF